jgi:TolB-like protein
MERRLAAILAADVVGYTGLMGTDEAGTLRHLTELRQQVLEPLIAEHHGRVVKLMGDGLLVEFASVVDAVTCAVAWQNDVAAQEAETDEDRRLQFRIGINIGDIIVEGDDIHGDGVNIAARLEDLAEPGGICLSGDAYRQSKGKIEAGFEDLGEQNLKNVAEPVSIYRIAVDGSGTAAALPAKVPLPLPDKPSIAVLPFANMSGDPDQKYFSDGITEDIVTELSRFHRLAVMSAPSSSRFCGTSGTLGTERSIGVQYMVEGSVRRLGARIRITSKLLDATTGNQLWAERFDRDIEQIFAVQDQIVKRIVGTIVGRVKAAGAERARRKLPANLEAYECVLRGKALQIGEPGLEAEARRLYERAIELDPGYALAPSNLSHMLSLEWLRDQSDSDELLDRAFELSKHAVALDANEPDCQNALGWIHLHRRSFDLAERYFRRALELNPNDAEQVAYMGVLHAFLGNPDDSLTSFQEAQRLDPFFEPSWYWTIQGVAHFTATKIEEAIAAFGRSPIMPVWVRVYLAACNALVGDASVAEEQTTDILRSVPDFSLNRFANKEPLRRNSDRERLIEGMRLARLPE